MHHVNAAGLNLPLDPAEAAIILAIPVAEGVEVEAADLPGYAKKGLFEILTTLGLDATKLKSAGMSVKGKSGTQLSIIYDTGGHIVALHGNGPWLRNSTLRSFKGLPELRSIRIDHNGFVGKDARGFVAPESDELLRRREVVHGGPAQPFVDSGQISKVEYVVEFNNNVLRVMIENDDYINIDDCVSVSKVVSEELDVLDPFKEAYMLEVTSAGAEKELRNSEEVKRAVGNVKDSYAKAKSDSALGVIKPKGGPSGN